MPYDYKFKKCIYINSLRNNCILLSKDKNCNGNFIFRNSTSSGLQLNITRVINFTDFESKFHLLLDE